MMNHTAGIACGLWSLTFAVMASATPEAYAAGEPLFSAGRAAQVLFVAFAFYALPRAVKSAPRLLKRAVLVARHKPRHIRQVQQALSHDRRFRATSYA